MLDMSHRSARNVGVALFSAIVLLVGAVCYSAFSPSAYPQLSASVSKEAASQAGADFAAEIGIEDFDAGRPTTTSNTVVASWFSLSRRPVADAARLPIYAWTIRDRKSTCRVTVLADGAAGGFSCGSQDAGRLSAAAVLRWITKQGASRSLVEDDVTAVLEVPGRDIRWTTTRDGTSIDYAFVHEGSTVSVSQQVHISEAESGQVSRSSFVGEGVSTTGFIATLILLVMAVGVLLRAEGVVRSRWLTALTTVLGVLVMAVAANNMTGATVTPPAGISEGSYRSALFLGNGFAAVLLFVTVKACGEAGATLPPVRFSKLAARAEAPRAVLAGMVLASSWLAVSTAGYAMAGRWEIVAVRLGPPDSFSLATALPVLTPLASALIAAAQEETLFRWFALRQIAATTRSAVAAMVLTSVIWALIHANYGVIPSTARVVELVPLGLMLVGVTVRYGILAAVTAHYVIDYITIAAPIVRASSAGNVAVLGVLFVIPLLAVTNARVRPYLDRFGGTVPPREEPAGAACRARRRLTLRSETGGDQGQAIQLRSLTKRYGETQVLSDVTLAVPYGCITCLLGPNGAGKTTLMRILVGHESLDEGHSEIRLRAGASLSGHVVGYVPDASLVYPLLTVREHIRLVDTVYGARRLSRDEEAALLEGLGLDQHGDHLASKLSKGLKKRLMLVCAVRQGADVLILDEPFDGLDPEGQESLMSLVAQLRDDGRCVLVSTHRLDIAERIADRLIVLDRGRVVFTGMPEGLAQLGEASETRTAFESAFAAVSRRQARHPLIPDLEQRGS